jgi:hypothetical protein
MFAEIPETVEFKRPQYVVMKEGRPTLFQFVDDHPERFYVHTIATSDGMYAKVPHRDDSELMNEEWFNQKYRPRWLYRVNVLDVTPYVINPTTGSKFNALAGNVPERDPVDGSSLKEIEPQPLNEVKILERGITLFRQFNSIMSSIKITNPDFDPTKVVFQLQVTGRGRDMVKNVYPRHDLEPVDVSEYEGFDLDLEDFTDEEITLMLKGTGLKKIWEARRNAVIENELPDIDDNKLDFSGGIPGLS